MELTIEGTRIFYTEAGSGLPLLLLHAFPLRGEMWEPQTAALGDLARLVVPDLRGFGQSDAPVGTYTMDRYALDAAALLDHLGWNRAVVGGLSMGGYIALALARLVPARVQALILSDTRAQADTPEGRAERHELAGRVVTEGPAVVADRMLPRMLGATTRAQRPDLVEHTRRLILSNQPAGIAGALLGMAERPNSIPYLADIRCPTLVIVGAEDTGTPPADAETIHRGITGSRLEVVPSAGHLANLENPGAWNAAVQAFLTDLAGG